MSVRAVALSLEETREQLSSMSEDRASIERTRADAQGRLAAAKKAVAEV